MRTLVLSAVLAALFALGCQTPAVARPNPVAVKPVAMAPATGGSGPADGGVAAAPKMELPAALAVPAQPAGLPEVEDSKDNPTTAEKVALGYQLFFDKRLSKDDSMSCESCHHPDKAWTDGEVVSTKVGGAKNKRNAPTMENLAFHTNGYYWDGRKPTIEATSAAAWNGQLGADPAAVAAKLNAVPTYRALFQRAFTQDATAENVPRALGAYLRALKSGGSAFDKFEAGDKKAASKEAQRGFEVFKNAGCALCHAPPLYSDFQFHNTGIGSDKPAEARDHGRMDASKDEKDDGKFKTPMLRDVAKTAPYFHDGSAKTLDEAIDLMAAGGRKNAGLDEKLKPQKLSKKDKAALKAFLDSLSGTATFTGAPAELPK